ncbi:PTS-dependent dihydroxyacetone kinase, ADP-binding subunit dhaL [Mannheimia haemolytica]|uniref:PTS-dependent dihydroxyacetone kinase, ADP-binding subunit dhaL n=1 Tax=Mannheimia haemolytica TaxID=75985 RepID=A0A378NAJ2_MANHA|nr:PTS-dependent dihydroxyacetone kinase, ADP-binding subunit dhaL [Mannheimia haemolytica]
MAIHGLNMQRGFSKALEKAHTVQDKDIGTLLKTVGMTLLSQVGERAALSMVHFLLSGSRCYRQRATELNELLHFYSKEQKLS